MLTRADIVDEARSWIGTPFIHQAQRKQVGCDCKGLVCGVCCALGMPEGQSLAANVRDYAPAFRGREMLAGLKATLRKVEFAEPGDLVAILWGRDPFPRHLAFVSDVPGWIIHSYGGGVRKVAEVPIGAWRVHSRWTWPSLEAAHG